MPEPEVEALPSAKKKTRAKTPAVTKRKPKQPDTLDALLPIHEQQDQPSNRSSHTITKPALPNKAQSIRHSEDGKVDNKRIEKDSEQERRHDTVAALVEEQPDQPPKKKKLVRRVRVPKVSTKQAVPTTDNLSAKATHADVPKAPSPTDDTHVDLVEALAAAPTTKKACKAPKRIFFNDDSDVDLDQMLSGIAAMAGTKTATKAATSKPSRATRKKAAS